MVTMTYDQLTNHFGSPAKTARFFGVSRAAVAQWKELGVPIGRQYEAEARTNGALRAERTAEPQKEAA